MTVELDGKRWEPVPGGTATAQDFIAARPLFHEIHRQCLWSPWMMQGRAADYDAALKTCGQWTSSDDPGTPRKTLEEYEAELELRLVRRREGVGWFVGGCPAGEEPQGVVGG
jgi:hypothetical protein